MSITAILPLKALGRSKQRLAGRLDAAQRRALMERLFAHVAGVCATTPGIDAIQAVVGDPAGGELAGVIGVPWVAEPAPDLNAAIAHATAATSDEASLVVVTDLPALTVADLEFVLAAGGGSPGVVVAATFDGGTAALLRRPADVIPTAFGPRSAAAHLDAGQRAGLRTALVWRAGLASDLDRPGDLDRHRGGRHDLGLPGPRRRPNAPSA